MPQPSERERVAVIAFYGPNDRIASKLVATIFEDLESKEMVAMEKWISHTGDVRNDPQIGEQVSEYLTRHNVERASYTDRIIGCPHEEGKDYPTGENCPQCPFWANRNRWSGETEEPNEEGGSGNSTEE
jgi:hypothetical protein